MSDPVLIALIVLGALAFSRLSGVVLRFAVRRVANSSARIAAIDGLAAPTRWWRASAPRGVLDSADGGEGRRRQRVNSAARMLNHIVTVIVWIGVSIATFQILDIDLAFFLTSAGFLGAGLAVGGQHKVNDYLTGLLVLFEDRYSVGDEILIERPAAEPVSAVVENIGLFTTRLRQADSTMHVPNGQITVVNNISQHAHVEKLLLHVGDDPDYDLVSERSAVDAVRKTAGQDHLTEIIFVGDLAAERRDDGDIEVSVHTAKPLDPRSRRTIVRKAEQALRGKR